jgi:protein TonB
VATNNLLVPRQLITIAFPIDHPLPPSPPPPDGAPKKQLPITTPAIPLRAPDAIIAERPIPISNEPIADFSNIGVVKGGDYVAPPPAPPAVAVPDQAPLRVGGVIKRPAKLRDVAPMYPPLARAAHVEGIVIIEATIGPDGRVQDARVLRPNPLLDAAALDAVRRWEFTPTLLNGIPVAVLMTVTVDFRLR